MTEIPEHLMRRAEAARRKAAGEKAEAMIPAHLLERVKAALDRQRATQEIENREYVISDGFGRRVLTDEFDLSKRPVFVSYEGQKTVVSPGERFLFKGLAGSFVEKDSVLTVLSMTLTGGVNIEHGTSGDRWDTIPYDLVKTLIMDGVWERITNE